MKVNIYTTVDVSNKQREQIARQIDGDGAQKRQATRDEIKEFVWYHGAAWETDLHQEFVDAPADELADLL